MQVIDNLKGIVLTGRCIEVIPAGTPVNDKQLRQYWQAGKLTRCYDALRQPVPYDRLVLSRGDEKDEHFVVLPKNEHHVLS